MNYMALFILENACAFGISQRAPAEAQVSLLFRDKKKTTSGSDLHQSCLTFCEESQEDKIIIFLFVTHR